MHLRQLHRSLILYHMPSQSIPSKLNKSQTLINMVLIDPAPYASQSDPKNILGVNNSIFHMKIL